MRDPTDILTLDLIDPPKRGRGRPRKADALSAAQRARQYRQRNASDIKYRRPSAQRDIAMDMLGRMRDRGDAPQAIDGAASMAQQLGLISADEWADIRNATRIISE